MEQELLTRIQREFPIEEYPFRRLASQLGVEEDEVLQEYRRLKEERIIRETSAIFDTKSLGFSSSLVAFKTDNIEEAVPFINSHPGVSHNYERTHPFNLWFTIAVPPRSRLGLERTVEIMAQKVGARDYLLLPTKKMFKIKVALDLTGKRGKKERVERRERIPMELEPIHFKLMELLQRDIEAVQRPFQRIVKELERDYEWLKEETRRLKEAGYMRRFATILHHRRAGFKANAMVVWNVEEERAEEVGRKVAEYSAVSHCYLRPTYENWPYPLFSMVHGRSRDEVEQVVQEIASEIEPKEYLYLYSTREFKKQRIRYFSPEFERWEAEHGG
ncbi:MAG: Lrp/AsnC family transcriptional regulator [Epsilonproteobacteria bacterium]|nr:Lrp/AsnC family transcriptional regulator [Campylobacterota bacterium]NPA57325.1 Lrp/AsnC family transcriptional regulator [Campylobacterota bacterium]